MYGCYSLPYFRKFRPEISCWRSSSRDKTQENETTEARNRCLHENGPSSHLYLDSTDTRGKYSTFMKKSTFFFPTDMECNIINNASRFSYCRGFWIGYG